MTEQKVTRNAKRGVECYAVVSRKGRAKVIIHPLDRRLSDVYGMHNVKREALAHARGVNRRLARRAARNK